VEQNLWSFEFHRKSKYVHVCVNEIIFRGAMSKQSKRRFCFIPLDKTVFRGHSGVSDFMQPRFSFSFTVEIGAADTGA